MDFKIRLSSPHMGGEELKYIQQAFDTNWIAPMGDNVDGFEQDLEHYLEQESHVAALNSGTAAIHLALILAGVKENDEVICQSLTFAASAFPILYQKAIPVFVDSERETWNICPNALEEAIKSRIKQGKKPKAIIVVHIFGMPAKMDEILQISKHYGIPLIEDAAEALGSKYKDQKCGSFGDYGVLSFNGNKIITTSGGGALITKSKRLKDQAIFLASQAKDPTDYYEHSQIGYNYRMSNIVAGIGRGQMLVLQEHIQKRRAMHQFYTELFKPYDFIKVFSEVVPNSYSNHWLTCIQFSSDKEQKNAKGLYEYLKTHGIESKCLWKPMHIQPVFKNCLYYGNQVSTSIFNTGLCLPSGSDLSEVDKERIGNVLLDYLDM